MWNTKETILRSNQISRFELFKNNQLLSRRNVIENWINDNDFRRYYNSILKTSNFESFFWENPPINQIELDKSYEFVLVKSTRLNQIKADLEPFREYFNTNQSIVTFPNIRGDATLIVPTPQSHLTTYAHLAEFVRNAPEDQIDDFWKQVGVSYKNHIGLQQKWLSTSGLGVYWLHVRIDSSPKYYQFTTYRQLT